MIVLQSVFGCLQGVYNRLTAVFALGIVVIGSIGAAHAQLGPAGTHYGSQKLVVNDTANAYDGFEGIAVDSKGNLYIAACAESGAPLYNLAVCKESLQGDGTYVESILFDYANNGLKGPYYVAVDSSDNVYISDEQGQRVVKETLSGSTYTQSVVTDYAAGGLIYPAGIAVDTSGNVYVSDFDNQRVLKETLSGSTYTQSIIGSGFHNPSSVAVDPAGNVYVADIDSGNVYKETLSGGAYTQTILVGTNALSFTDTCGLATDSQGNVYIIESGGSTQYDNQVLKVSPAGAGYDISVISSAISYPWAAAVDSSGNVFVSGFFNQVTEISTPPTSFGTVAVGTTSAALTFPFTVGVNLTTASAAAALSLGAGSEFTDAGTGTCDTNGTSHVYKAGETCTVDVTFSPRFAGLRSGAVVLLNPSKVVQATMYISGTGTGPQVAFSPGVQSVVASGFTSPSGVGVDGNGVVYITDAGNNGSLFVETPSGTAYAQTTVSIANTAAPGPLMPQGVAVDGVGNVYFADSHDNFVTTEFFYKGQNTSFTPLAYPNLGNGLAGPTGLAADSQGNVYVADTGNNRVVEEAYVSGNTYMTPPNYEFQDVVAAGLKAPQGVAADGSGNVYIADTGNNRILKETPSGGGNFTQSVLFDSGLSAPAGVAVDDAGDLFIADTGNKRVLQQMVAGSGYTQSIVPLAGLGSPQAIAVNAGGDLFIADSTNGDVIKLARATATTLTFASTADGSTSSDSPQTVTLENVGTAPLTFAIPASGNNPSISANFTLNSTGGAACPLLTTSSSTASLAANATCTLPISFTPLATGSISGSLILTDNALNVGGGTQTITLDGTGSAGAEPAVTLDPTSVAFAVQTAGTTSPATTVKLTNSGSAALALTGFTLTGTNASNFSVDSSACPASLAAAASCNLAVTFAPTASGSFSASISIADDAANTPQTVPLTGTAANVTETGNLWFNPAQVAIAPASAQTLTATFTLTGFTTALTPTAKMHYGISYVVGAVTCTGAAGNQTCTVPVTFLPVYPGGRKDALFLMNGSTRLATQLAYGVGESPFALAQPGVISTPFTNSPTYLYGSISDESGNVYIVLQEGSGIEQVTAAGVATVLPITNLNSPREVGIDGAGVLYIADQKPNSAITTYDTVQGTQGTFPWPVPNDLYIQSVAVGNEGTIYEADYSNIYVFPLGSTTATVVPINPSITQPGYMSVDSAEDVFIAGYSDNELSSGGSQMAIAVSGGSSGFGIDAANSIYLAGQGSGVAQYAASSYGTQIGSLDQGADDISASVGADGKVYGGNFTTLDVVDRSQGAPIAFGAQQVNTASSPSLFQVYNGGNENLTLATFTVTGDGFALQTGTANPCVSGMTILPGALCNAPIVFTGTHSGNFTGSINYSSNTLNTSATTGTVALSAYINGINVSVTPSPLNFANQVSGTTSATQTVTLTNNGVNADAGNISTPSSVAGFTITQGTCTGQIAPGASCAFNVTFSPTAVQAYTGTASFTAGSDASTQTQALSFTLNGTGTAATSGNVTATPATLNLGSETEYTENYNPSYITLTNNSSSTVTFSNFQSADVAEFYSQAYTCADSGVLLGGTSCQLTVRFSPLSVGVINSTVTMPYTGDGGGTLVVNLTGTGTTGTPTIDLYPLPAQFGTVPVGTAATALTLQVEDTGTAPLTSLSFSITGADASDYTTSNNCSGVAVDPYPGTGTCNVIVNFTPAGVGPRSATLNVSSNGGAATFATALSGAGAPVLPQVQFTPTQLNLLAGVAGTCGDTTAGGAATAATLCNVNSAAQDYLGNTYLVDTHYNVVYKVDTSGQIAVFAGTPSTTGGFDGDGGLATGATLQGPTAVAADAYGNVFISDTGNGAVREVDAAMGNINTVVSSACIEEVIGRPQLSRKGAARPRDVLGFACLASFQPEGLVFDTLGNLFIADPADNYVWESPFSASLTDSNGGSLTVVAGSSGSQGGAGTAGYTGDKGLATAATLQAPQDVAVDALGNLYIADTANHVVRLVTATTGIITTFAGTGTAGNTGDGTAATGAEINAYGVATDLAGDVFIAAGAGGVVRKVDTTGNITTFAGGGTGALGGPAATGAVAEAYLVRADNLGDLLIPAGLQVLVAGPDGLLQFGTETVGSTSAALTAMVENTGDTNLSIESAGTSITGTNAGDFAISGNNCGTSLAPGKTCALNVTFAPSATGARTASVSVGTNAAGSPQTVILQGNGSTASAPAASLSPTALSFPDTATGSTATALTTTLSNTGNAALSITGVTLGGANPADFAETNNCGSSLAAGSTCTISVTFTPASASAFTASVSVADNATGSPQTATLSGAGTMAAAPVATLSPSSLTFANTVSGVTTAAQTLTLSNTGNAALTISGITLGGTNPSSFAETTTCGATLAAAASCTIAVTFTPSSVASLTASVSVADNAAGSPQTSSLSGTGLQAPDFTVSSSTPSQTVQPGGAAQYALVVAATNGDFTGTVALTATGLPPGATASFAPASVTPGSTSASSLFTIQTGTAQARSVTRGNLPWVPITALAFCVPLFWWRKRNRGRLMSAGLLCALLSVTALFATGCGGGYYLNTSKTYTITVTGTSGSSQHSTTVTLIIQ